ncbi:metalloregulator ArsR/SmtB family transcription factor [Rhizobium sp. NFR12]|uniref:ArsR/SmtB family transcription factor n=1 Tax=Rhizobium sp. NFR12 TaxID=1566261 RepID=UPI0008A7B6F4|nr:metalloregulator ArsR/SmtB family transcription factor [Rhizobium sp. NFR12]SEH30947.1 DNA-binding transcriptional regulator, ArsR family [Rhizobium sp. NFR12]
MSKTTDQLYTFNPKTAAKLLSLMSSPLRLGILQRVILQEWDVNALASDLKISQSALSQRLSMLRETKLVTTRRSAQQVIYSSDSAAVVSMLETLAGLGLMSREASSVARREIQPRKSRIRSKAA